MALPAWYRLSAELKADIVASSGDKDNIINRSDGECVLTCRSCGKGWPHSWSRHRARLPPASPPRSFPTEAASHPAPLPSRPWAGFLLFRHHPARRSFLPISHFLWSSPRRQLLWTAAYSDMKQSFQLDPRESAGV